jgi:hypothetical protein
MSFLAANFHDLTSHWPRRAIASHRHCRGTGQLVQLCSSLKLRVDENCLFALHAPDTTVSIGVR